MIEAKNRYLKKAMVLALTETICRLEAWLEG